MAWSVTPGTYLGPGATAAPAFPVPASVAAGQLIEVNFSVTGSATVTGVPTGFVLKASVTDANCTQYTYWKRASGADTGTYNFTLSGSGNVSGQAVKITGGTPTGNPYRDTVTATAHDPASSASSPAVTAAGEVAVGDLIRFVAARASNGTMTAPAGYTLQTGAGSQRLHVAYLAQAASGTPAGIVSTWGTAATNRTAMLLALIPAPTALDADYAGTGTLSAESHSTFETTGSWESDPIDLSLITVAGSSKVVWNATVPTGGSVTVETSLDGGSTWDAASNGDDVVGINSGDDLGGIELLIRVSLTGPGGATPQVRSLAVTVNQTRDWHFEPTLVDKRTRFNLGIFVLTTPDRKVSESPATYQVQGYDKLKLLQHRLGDTYVVSAGTSFVSAMKQAIIDSGATGLPPLISSTFQGKVLQATMVWHDTEIETSWLRVVNDLGSAINYRGLWADPETGRFRSEPYQPPATRPVEYAFDLTDERTDIVDAERTLKIDEFVDTNWWRFIRQNSPTQPIEGDGLYTVDNSNGQPRIPVTMKLTAADHPSLVSQGDQIVAQAAQRKRTLAMTTGPIPVLGHFDMGGINDPKLGDPMKAQASDNSIPLDGSSVSITWEII